MNSNRSAGSPTTKARSMDRPGLSKHVLESEEGDSLEQCAAGGASGGDEGGDEGEEVHAEKLLDAS